MDAFRRFGSVGLYDLCLRFYLGLIPDLYPDVSWYG
jgi:hypothetical protein